MTADTFYLCGEEVQGEPYRYRACGLDGIYLLNGYTIEQHDDEQHVTIRDLDGLHKAIGRHLVMHRKAISPREIRFLRNTLGLTQADLAQKLGNNSQSVARWEKGDCDIPGAAEKLLRAIFLVSIMDKEELKELLEKLETILVGGDLDQLDDASQSVQFQLFGSWEEKTAA